VATSANILAIFAPKAPVESTPPQDHYSENDDGFKNFLEDAIKQGGPPQENYSSRNSDRQDAKSLEQNAKVAKSSKDAPAPVQKTKTSKPDPQNKASTPASSRKSGAVRDANDAAAADPGEELTRDLESLDLNEDQIKALLDLLASGNDAGVVQFLQNLLGNVSLDGGSSVEGQDPSSLKPQDLLAQMKEDKARAIDLLVQAGLSRQDARDLVTKLETAKPVSGPDPARTSAPVPQEDVVALADSKGGKPIDAKGSGSSSANDPNREGVKSNKVETADGKAPPPKPPSHPDSETPRVTIDKPEAGKPASPLKQNEQGPELKLVGADASAKGPLDAASPVKNLAGVKGTVELQVQNVGSGTDGSSRTAEAAKPVTPESIAQRGIPETKIVSQILDKFSLRTAGNGNEVKIKLDPPSLGTVRMSVSTVGETVRTTIIAENHAVKQVIENNLSQLKDSMSAQGLKMDNVTVLVGGESQQNQGNPHKGPDDGRSFSSAFRQEALNQKAASQEAPPEGRWAFRGSGEYQDSISIFA